MNFIFYIKPLEGENLGGQLVWGGCDAGVVSRFVQATSFPYNWIFAPGGL